MDSTKYQGQFSLTTFIQPHLFTHSVTHFLLGVRHPPIPALNQTQDIMIAIAVSSATAFASESCGFDAIKKPLFFRVQGSIAELVRPFHTLFDVFIRLTGCNPYRGFECSQVMRYRAASDQLGTNEQQGKKFAAAPPICP